MYNLLYLLNTYFKLSFQGSKLEKEYQKFYIKEHKEQNILAAKIAIILYFIYAPLTYALTHNESMLLLLVVLFSISGPFVFLLLSRTKLFEKYPYCILFLAAFIAGLGPALFYAFTTNDRAIFQVDQIIPIIAIFTMLGIGFSLALLIYISILVSFLSLVFLVGVPLDDIYMALYTNAFAAMISAVSGYLLEKSQRRLFLAKMKSDEFKFVVDNAHDAISIFDTSDYHYLYANKRALKRNNKTLEEILNQTLFDVHKSITVKMVKSIVKSLDTKGSFSDILALEDDKGETYYVHNVSQYGYFDSQKVIISVSSDVTELKKAELKMREMALLDPLTKLFNRYKFDEYSMLELRKFPREKQNVALVICDIDHFKEVNDTYGHLEGDKVLMRIANMLQRSVRETDLVARWGGEEFAILLLHTPKEEAVKIAQKIHTQIAALEHDNMKPITVSCGVSELREGDTQTTWFNRVDDALYEAKENGRNRVVYK